MFPKIEIADLIADLKKGDIVVIPQKPVEEMTQEEREEAYMQSLDGSPLDYPE